jgi:predicted phosphoribosyltransferase
MGAIATGGVRVLNDQLVERIGEQAIEAIAARERQELERRERLYRGDRPPPDVRGRTVIRTTASRPEPPCAPRSRRCGRRIQPAL